MRDTDSFCIKLIIPNLNIMPLKQKKHSMFFISYRKLKKMDITPGKGY